MMAFFTQASRASSLKSVNYDPAPLKKSTVVSNDSAPLKKRTVVSNDYICDICKKLGDHSIKECPMKEFKLMAKAYGIPKDMYREVSDPTTEGAMITHEGKFVVPNVANEAGTDCCPPLYFPVPEYLNCPFCRYIYLDPLRLPCCQAILCAKCIDEHLFINKQAEIQCPVCDSVKLLLLLLLIIIQQQER